MSIQKIVFGMLGVVFIVACSNDDMISEEAPALMNDKVVRKSGKDRDDATVDINQITERSSLPRFRKKPPCSDIVEGYYFPVRIVYYNFPYVFNPRLKNTQITEIRRAYENYYNSGDCLEIIISYDQNSITCERDTCSEIWYLFKTTYNEIKPEGGGTLEIDVEAPGP